MLPRRYASPDLVARGGMGEVYRATDTALERTVAIKVLSDRYARQDDARARFRREALAAARVSAAPNVVTVFDVAEHDGRPLIVMEYLEGGSVYERLRSGRVPARSGAHLARAGGGRARPRTCERHRAPRRQAGEPPPRSRRQRPRLRLRDRVRHGSRHAHGAGDRARHRRIHIPGAGSGRAGDGGERPLRAGGRGVRAPDRSAAVRRRYADHRGVRAPPRARPARRRRRSDSAAGARLGVRVGTREGSWRTAGERSRARATASRGARRRRPRRRSARRGSCARSRASR